MGTDDTHSIASFAEEEPVDGDDAAKDRIHQELARCLQELFATSPEKLSDYEIGFLAYNDSELAMALATLREDHAELNELKKARGYFRETFDGTFTPEATAADRRQARPGGRPQSLDHAAAASDVRQCIG